MEADTMMKKTVELLQRAIERHGMSITPCVNKKTFRECLTTEGDEVFLWYNDSEHSTHLIKAKNV